MAKRIGTEGTPRGQGRGMRRQVPPGVVVAAIVVTLLLVGFIMWRTGAVGGGGWKQISDEMRAVHRTPAFQVPVDPKTGQSLPYSPDVVKKLEKSPAWTPEAEKYRPK